ncbi:MAG: alpha-glucosidase [Verrucomicrobiales bacterium]|jgi:alpha-glucosidase
MAEDPNKPQGNYMENDLAAAKAGNENFPSNVVLMSREVNWIEFVTDNKVALRISFLTAEIVRLRYACYGEFGTDFSYAIDELPARDPVVPEVDETTDGWNLKTDALTVVVQKSPLRVHALRPDGKPLLKEEKGFHWEDHHDYGGEIVKMSKKLHGNECFYGLGDKSCELNLRKKRVQLWGSDTYGYGKDSDPLYKNIPFYIGLHAGGAYGVFFDNSFRSFFDFGHERKTVVSFWAQGGEMNYYMIAGPEPADVVRRFSWMTGKHELPPMWAMGYHQCKWSYRSDEEFRALAAKFRELSIPCDALYLDIDYMDGFRCFTWNRETFPEPAKMIGDLREDGFRTVVIIDPGIKIDPDYPVYIEGKARDLFCRRGDGPLMKGSVWPGECVFPDFTRPDVRDWWAGLFKELIADDGVAGVWNDMNEPAVFEMGTFPRDVRHDYDGNPCSHRKAHNIYGMQMVRASCDGVQRFNGGQRPFLITRSAYAGTQRYCSGWTGDNVASWEHLRIANLQCQRLSMSGMSFVGSDIGGFIEQPNGELYVRWLAMAVFHPLCRTHSSGDQGDQEPWSFGERLTKISRKFIELRYRLLPYLYTTFWQHSTNGDPFLRSLFSLDAADIDTHNRAEEFGVGDHLLVCPISQPKTDGRWLYLPEGEWLDFWNDNPEQGRDEVWATAPLERIPLYVRACSVLPMDPVRQSTSHPTSPVRELHVYDGSVVRESVLYDDAGDGYGYRDGEFCLQKFIVDGDASRLLVTRTEEGNFTPHYHQYEVVLHGSFAATSAIKCDGERLESETRSNGRVLSVTVPRTFKILTIVRDS